MPAQFTTERIPTGATSSVAVQVYQAAVARPAPLVLHLRASGFQPLRPDANRPVAALLADAGAVVVSADYPAGAMHPFPDALETTYRVLQHLHAHKSHWAARGSKLFVAGEEAGGNLAAALSIVARDRLGPPIAGQILLSPMLDAGMATCSFRNAEAGPVGCKWADGWRAYLGTPEQACHPYAAPACASRLAGLPPALVFTAQDDPMRDESLLYGRRLHEAGVVVNAHTLMAPSAWPDALAGPASTVPPPNWHGPGWREPDWAAAVRPALADFFAAFTPNLVPARS